MSSATSSVQIGIYGCDERGSEPEGGCGLWPASYAGAITAAGARPVYLPSLAEGVSWDKLLAGMDGVVLVAGQARTPRQKTQEAGLFEWCRKRSLPLLGVDQGLHLLNNCFGGSIYEDLARELPEALQHRHPPEPGLRHAITVAGGTQLAKLYGEGEIVVNSEHRRAVQRVARGFRVSARALDGVIEAIEAETNAWFALGVQWHPASPTASGLDIQLFRGLVEACCQRRAGRNGRSRVA
jgi:putative glutamine amidotransferase